MYRILFVFILFASNFAGASHAPDFSISKCSLTPEVLAENYGPTEFLHSNNLAKKPGVAITAEGEIITIYGRIVDENCVPVADAKVGLWQTNTHGIYQYEMPKKLGASSLVDEHFAGSGSATTNNIGQFSFITVIPGVYEKQAPHFNVRIHHFDFNEFETQIYLTDQGDIYNSKALKKLGKSAIEKLIAKKYDDPINGSNLNNNKIYYIEITLKGNNKHRKY